MTQAERVIFCLLQCYRSDWMFTDADPLWQVETRLYALVMLLKPYGGPLYLRRCLCVGNARWQRARPLSTRRRDEHSPMKDFPWLGAATCR